jgi:hypothetical protein
MMALDASSRTGDVLRGDIGATARLILDEGRLAEDIRDSRREDPCREIGRPARWVRRNDLDGPGRIRRLLRIRWYVEGD